MKDESKTTTLTVTLNLFGLLMVIASCVFMVLAFSNMISLLGKGYVEDEELIKSLLFMVIGCMTLLLSHLAFTAELYKSLSKLEKEVYDGKRKNR